MPSDSPRIGFLGAGKMATALARGWIATGMVAKERCRASDPVDDLTVYRNAGSVVEPELEGVHCAACIAHLVYECTG